MTDTQAIAGLIQVEAGIARAHSLRARLVALLAENRPATADRPNGRPGAAGKQTRRARKTATATPGSGTGADGKAGSAVDGNGAGQAASTDPDTLAEVVPEVLDVSEWLAHELQMAHPYSFTAAQALVETSLILTGRLSATLGLLRAGGIDYRRAQILTDLLGTCTETVAHTWRRWCCHEPAPPATPDNDPPPF